MINAIGLHFARDTAIPLIFSRAVAVDCLVLNAKLELSYYYFNVLFDEEDWEQYLKRDFKTTLLRYS
jgi:hypothetical protein